MPHGSVPRALHVRTPLAMSEKPARREQLVEGLAVEGLVVEGIERPGGWPPLRLDNPAEVPRDL